MANKRKKVVETNLQKIREDLGLNQKEMGDKLGVTGKTIRNYEYYVTNLPVQSAMELAITYGYSLDWIYIFSSLKKTHSTENTKPKFITDQFIVDIRDFISFSNETVHFSIPDYYWNYIKQRNAIFSSNLFDIEKKRKIMELNASYESISNENFYYRFSIPKSEFMSYLHFDNEFTPYLDSDTFSSEEHEATEEQKKEVKDFFDSLLI